MKTGLVAAQKEQVEGGQKGINLLCFESKTRVGPRGCLWDGPQVWDAERRRLFALPGVWDDGVGDSRVSSSHCSAEQLQQEWERLQERLNRGNDGVRFYSASDKL